MRITEKRRGPGEKHDPVLVWTGELRPLRARMLKVVQKYRVKRSIADGEDARIDAWRVEWLRAESDGAIGNRRSARNSGQIAGLAGEIDDIPRFGYGDVDREDGGIFHPIQRQNRPVD